MPKIRRCATCLNEIDTSEMVCRSCGGTKINTIFGSQTDVVSANTSELVEAKALPFCTKCGAKQENDNKFCGQCGANSIPVDKVSSGSLADKFIALSTKGKFFYSSWILVNVIFVLRYITESSKPVDRFRSLCNWDGVNCAPSSQELANEALSNLIVWNILFLIFLFVYKKIMSKKSK